MLITLVIIGVIAALTIPNLLVKYEKEQTVTKLKKFYSEFSNAISLSEIDNGPINTWNFPYQQFTVIDFNNTYIKNYTKGKLTNGYQVKDILGINNTLGSFINGNTYSLPDGTIYTTRTTNANNTDLFLMVDINGPKKPNRFGKDVFLLYIHKNKRLQPYGYNLTREQLKSTSLEYGCNKEISTGRTGGYCAALIQRDNWQIKDDYPW